MGLNKNKLQNQPVVVVTDWAVVVGAVKQYNEA